MKEKLPKWLEDQQHHSWQIEILIAGSFVFFLANLPQYFEDLFWEVAQGTIIRGEVVILLTGGFLISRALLIGFIVNLILRALWLAFLGINFSFPKGVDYQKLGYSDWFNERDKKTASVVERILNLEKYSSLSYSIAILMTLMSAGLFLLLILFFFLISYAAPSLNNPEFGFFVLIAFGLLILGILDVLFFKVFRKSKTVSKSYFPFYKIFGFLSLTFLYRKAWLVLISNVNRWKIYAVFIFYFFIALVIASNEIGQFLTLSKSLEVNLYEDRKFIDFNTFQAINSRRYSNMIQPGQHVSKGCLNKEIISEKHFSLFMTYLKRYDSTLEYIFNRNNVATEGFKYWEDIEKNDSLFVKSLSEYFTVNIDSKKQENLQWFVHRHPKTNERGFITYLDSDSLEVGYHKIRVDIKFVQNDSLKNASWLVIPFIKE